MYNSTLIHMGKKHYICICIPIITIDSILKIDKRVSHQAYSKHFIYRLRDYDLHVSSYSHAVSFYQLIIDIHLWSLYIFLASFLLN